MRFAAGCAAFFLLSGISAVAQSTAPTTTTPPQAGNFTCTFETLHPDGKKHGKGNTITECRSTVVVPPACPVDMHVRQGFGGGMIAVDESGVRRKVFAPRLRLFLNDVRKEKAGQTIVSATVTVHGSSGKARMLPLDAGSGGHDDLKSEDVERTLSVDLANWGEPGVSGDFRLPGLTSARRIDLQSVTYEDGSTWKLSGDQTCHVAPDPVMLINQ
jgi:hypothetical protein